MARLDGGEGLEVEVEICSGGFVYREDGLQPLETFQLASQLEGYCTPRSSKSVRLGLDSSPRSTTQGSRRLITVDLTGQRERSLAADGQGVGRGPTSMTVAETAADGQGTGRQYVSMTAVEHPSETAMSEGAGGDDVEEREGLSNPCKTPSSPSRAGDVDDETRNREASLKRNEET